ncbi:MAG: winged helix-turn-helix domain-containing protein [Clostridia bacterium]|nr:winged helix-turn-helix domain-containing protein [Clostridia bacterium]
MILIVHPTLKHAKQAADIFYYMGIPAVARRPKEALSEISLCYRAVLLCHPSALPAPEDYLERMRSLCGGVPIFSLAEDMQDHALSPLFSLTFDATSYSSHIFSRIRAYQESHSLPLLGSYTLAGLCLDCDAKRPYYCDRPVDFTKTEAMILRYLIRTYPESADVHHILRYAMRPDNLSEPASIRTHIWSINRKFIAVTGRRLITSLPGEGYRIVTPEVEAALI